MEIKDKVLGVNGAATDEEKARQLLESRGEEKRKEFLNKYEALCKEYGMRIEAQIQMVLKQN